MEQTYAVREMWAAGDYPAIGDLFGAVGRTLVAEVGVAGLDVLDVATGAGNTAIAAAAAGGRVTGLDITPELLDVARRRAAMDGLSIRWIEADMTRLDLPDRAFDRVLSTFGTMLAPRPAEMAAELLRVCRPGGLVATTAWRPDSGFAKLGEVLAAFLPAAGPADPPVHDPADWGRPERVNGFFAGLPATVSSRMRAVTVSWPSVDIAIEMLTTRCGPVAGAVAALTESGRWPQARAAVAEMLAAQNRAADGTLTVDMPYLVTVARPA